MGEIIHLFAIRKAILFAVRYIYLQRGDLFRLHCGCILFEVCRFIMFAGCGDFLFIAVYTLIVSAFLLQCL